MTLDDLLKLSKKPRRVVPVQAGSQTLYVRGLSAADCEEAGRIAGESEGAFSVRTVLMAMALCEQDGTPLCGDVVSHAASLGDLPATLVRRIDVAIDQASEVDSGSMAELVGNSHARTDGSDTDSPSQ